MFSLLFVKQTFAVSPIVNITEPLPTNMIVGDEFTVTFTVNSINIGTIYHYKVVGDDNADLSTLPNTSCSSNYENCESLTITTDKIATATAKTRLNTSTGSDNIKVRIAQSDKHSSTYDSSFITILSLTPTSTPIPTPTLTPTPTPTKIPTITPTPTKIPTPTIKITPTKIPTEATISAILEPTQIPEVTETPTVMATPTSGETLGDATQSATKKNFLPLIFIVLGGILLLTPLIISKIKKQ